MNEVAANPQLAQLERKANLSHQLTVGLLLTLLAFFALWYGVIRPPATASPWLISLFHIIPLALFLPWMLKRNPRTYIWFCFIILLYFCEGVINAFALPHLLGWLGLIESVLVTVVFITSMYAARWNSQLQRQGR
ncbi:MAG: DUF2069 domain-containing protein [Pseudomonadales bacterium]|nr:DUF2069 domain-containing protein [Pseudomonadales bacterium]